MKPLLIALFLVIAVAGAYATARADTRPTMSAIRVPDGAIKVDGRLDDWPAAARFAPYQATAATADHTNFGRTEAGPWLGPNDLSVSVRAAHDSKYLYVAGIVHDQLWFNAAGTENPWVGDAFEIFVDANPVDKQFQKGTNENFEQFIFIPQHINQLSKTDDNESGVFIWPQAKSTGVLAASRLTPLGYTIEIAIPKDSLPNWKTDANLASIGFDVSADDIDTPGLFGHDAGPKAIMFLLSPNAHFLSAEQLGNLQLDAAIAPSGGKREQADASQSGYAKAQDILDNFSDADIADKANQALDKPDLARRAALFVLMRRPELAIDFDKLVAILHEPANSEQSKMLLDARVYAMVALAERHALPITDALARFGASDDPLLRNTCVYCAGLNGDKSAIPELVKLYPSNPGSRTQEIIATSLAQLGDPTGVPTLEDDSYRDRGQLTAKRDIQLLAQLEIFYTPKAQ